MKYQLIKDTNSNYSTIEQILTNRGIAFNMIDHYLHTTDEDINSPEKLEEGKMKAAAARIIETVASNSPALIIVDCDCDGYTSAALLINYLYEIFPTWVETRLHYLFHEGKEHGLNDCMDEINQNQYKLVIVPDARK